MVFGVRNWLKGFVLRVMEDEFEKDQSRFNTLQENVSLLNDHAEYIHGRLKEHDGHISRFSAHSHPVHPTIDARIKAIEAEITKIAHSASPTQISQDLGASVEEFRAFVRSEVGKIREEVAQMGQNDAQPEPVPMPETVPQPSQIEEVIEREERIKPPKKTVRRIITKIRRTDDLPQSVRPALNTLLNAEHFITYAELAQSIGKKEATARSYVNQMRKYGITIDEISGDRGRKELKLANSVKQKYLVPE